MDVIKETKKTPLPVFLISGTIASAIYSIVVVAILLFIGNRVGSIAGGDIAKGFPLLIVAILIGTIFCLLIRLVYRWYRNHFVHITNTPVYFYGCWYFLAPVIAVLIAISITLILFKQSSLNNTSLFKFLSIIPPSNYLVDAL